MMGAWGWTCALALGAGALAVGTVVRPAWRILPAGMALIPGRHGWVLVACLVGGLALWAQQASGVIAAGMGVATAVRLVARMRAQRALARRRAALAHLLGLLVTQLEAGTDPGRAVAQLARHAQEPHAASLIPELRALAATEGAQHTDALLAPIAAVWTASREHGVPLAGLLSQAQARLDAAVRQRSSTAAALTGPTSTAVILSALPVAGLGLGAAMGAHPVRVLTSGGLGGLLLVVGVALLCAGVLWSQAIIARAGVIA